MRFYLQVTLRSFLKLLQKLYICTFLLYIPFLLIITFFVPVRERIVKTYEYHFIPLKNIVAEIKDPAQYNTAGYWRIFAEGLIGNFLLFIPLGFFLKFFIARSNSTLLLYALALSVLIELIQLIFHWGVCDIDDVILNSIGALAGIGLCAALHFKK